VSRLALDANQQRVALASVPRERVLQRRPAHAISARDLPHTQNREPRRLHVLEAVQRGHTVVVVACRDEDGGILALFRYSDVVQGRIRNERLKLCFRSFRAAVIGAPRVTDGELVEAQHVGDGNLADDAAEQIRSLICAHGHEQAAVAATLDGQLCRGRVSCTGESEAKQQKTATESTGPRVLGLGLGSGPRVRVTFSDEILCRRDEVVKPPLLLV
jgi:hypothetical protein